MGPDWTLHVAVVAVLSHQGIPYRTVQLNKWRSAVYGVGGRLKSDQAKRMAVDMAQQEGIDTGGHGAAEAACLLTYQIGHYHKWLLDDQAAA